MSCRPRRYRKTLSLTRYHICLSDKGSDSGLDYLDLMNHPSNKARNPSFEIGSGLPADWRTSSEQVVSLASPGLFDRLTTETKALFARDPSALVPAIVESVRIKADVVSRDEREGGLRRILNYGHTIGHALEAVTRYRRFRHGEAIDYGMLAAADLGVTRGALAERDRTALSGLITQLGPLPPVGDLAIDEVLEAAGRDKKVVHGRLHFVIATAIGATTTVDDVSETELRGVLGRLGLKR